MPETKRKFRRFDMQLGVIFRPTYGATDYATGVTTNISCEGLGLDADDFKFIMYENLELLIGLPGKGDSVSLSGDVLWKNQDGKRCSAGVKFRMKDKAVQEEALAKIFSASNVPEIDMYNCDWEYKIHKEAEKKNKKALLLPNKLGFIKQYNGDGKKCKVTFRLLKEMAKNSQNVALAGEFNNWDASKSPMTRLDNGDFVITLELFCKRRYRFKYLIDGQRWENDWYADRFVRNDEGSKDSVVIV
ncbi:MAG: PilZ domain-containing protein [Nitrospirae bacterium]|nr:PilZ domain-containing protein [Nitrospirota bacterium]